MGGQGSGRPPSVETIIKRNQPVVTPVGNDLFLPNYSGIQKAALKTSPDLSGSGISDHSALSNLDYASAGHTGFQPAGSYLTSETDPIFMSLSGSLPYEATLTKGNLTASGSGITVYGGTGSIIGTGVQIAVNAAGEETDPVFMSLSGSLPYVTDETAITGSGSTTVYGTFPNFTIGSTGGAESDPVFMSLSGSLPYEATLSKGNLTASGTNVVIYGGTNAVIGAGSQISVTETDPVFMALSGGFAVSSKGVTNGDSHDHNGGDGAQIAYSSLSGKPTLPANEAGAANNFLSAYNSTTGAWTKAQPTWANINKSTSSIADITTKSHTALSDIGTNTHAQIDSHISDTSDPHGATLTQTTLYGTTLSGTNVYGTTGVWGTTVSGANVYSTGVFSGASVYAANITVPTSISGALFMTTTDSTTSGSERMRNILVGTEAVTALSAAQYYRGTIYLKYTA